MNIFLVTEYVKRLRKEDINTFALKQGIILTEDEIDIIFDYIKKDYKTLIYGNPRPLLDEVRQKVRPLTYNKIENLYEQFKDKL